MSTIVFTLGKVFVANTMSFYPVVVTHHFICFMSLFTGHLLV